MIDDLTTCPRCKGQDALLGSVCWTCQQELMAYHDYQISWRAAWELEKREHLRDDIQRNPVYVQEVLADFNRLIQRYSGEYPDPDTVAILESGRSVFLARLEAVYQKHPELRPKEANP